jgi:hypothetical protein
MSFQTFGSIEAFFDAEKQAQAEARAAITAEQQNISVGDFCAREMEGFTIYSEVLSAAGSLLGGRSLDELDEEERVEYADTKELSEQEPMQCFRFTRSYSLLCPNGELGDIHLSTVRKISKAEFLKAKEAGWR